MWNSFSFHYFVQIWSILTASMKREIKYKFEQILSSLMQYGQFWTTFGAVERSSKFHKWQTLSISITLCKNVIGDHYCTQQQRKWALPFVKNFHFLTDPWQKSGKHVATEPWNVLREAYYTIYTLYYFQHVEAKSNCIHQNSLQYSITSPVVVPSSCVR